MFGFMKSVKNGEPKPIAKLTAAELRNVLEQRRLTEDAIKVQKMLAAALEGTMTHLVTKYGLSSPFELDRETGEIFAKESSNG